MKGSGFRAQCSGFKLLERSNRDIYIYIPLIGGTQNRPPHTIVRIVGSLIDMDP